MMRWQTLSDNPGWSGENGLAHLDFQTHEAVIGTARSLDVGHIVETWQAQRTEKVVPLWRVRDSGRIYRTRKPVAVHVYRDGYLFFAENENLAVYAYADTQEQALLELVREIVYFYQYYQELDHDSVTGDAVRLKALFEDLLLEEQSCPSTNAE